MIGAELVLKCLEKKNVDTVFGIPGGVLIPLYDVLKKSTIKHVLTRHEQGAVHAADGYARSTGEVGVCFATSGPGATNLLTGLETAMMDSVPIVAITGQVPQALIGKDSFQEADTVGFSLSSTKYNYLVKDAEDLPTIIEEAFFIASNGRPGPVLIDIPKDVMVQIVGEPEKKINIRKHVEKKLARPKINDNQMDKIVKEIGKAQKPVILVGGGVITANASEMLIKIAKKHNIPVVNTLMGKGAFPAGNDLYLGMLGMHGTVKANYAVQESDLIIGVGLRFGDRVTGKLDTFAPKAKIIHVDIEPAEIDKNVKTAFPIVAHALDFFKELDDKLLEVKDTGKWVKELVECHKEKHISQDGVQPEYILNEINELIDEDTIIVTDVGQHQMWSALYLHPKAPKSFLTSGGLGTMGFGLPAAIGAQFANPGKKVILITGDGSFQMNLQELSIVRQYNLPIKIMLMNNGCLGMVRQWQELFCNSNYSQTLFEHAPDWDLLAKAYGIDGARIENREFVSANLKNLIQNDEPILFDVRIDDRANVFPMVPAGCSLDEIWGCE